MGKASHPLVHLRNHRPSHGPLRPWPASTLPSAIRMFGQTPSQLWRMQAVVGVDVEIRQIRMIRTVGKSSSSNRVASRSVSPLRCSSSAFTSSRSALELPTRPKHSPVAERVDLSGAADNGLRELLQPTLKELRFRRVSILDERCPFRLTILWVSDFTHRLE